MPTVSLLRMRLVSAAVLVFISSAGYCTSIYQQPGDFISEVFQGADVTTSKLWLDKGLQAEIREILGHDLGVLRLRYWGRGKRTAWILDEIGKEQPITVGIVINEDRIERVSVLIYRETRGWEVRYPFFTDQFSGAMLNPDERLSNRIDGISGATMSVHAVTRLARLALLLHRHTRFAGSR